MNKCTEKAIVYPFNDTLIPLLNYLNIPNIEMSITTVVDTKRRFLKGKDVGYIKNQPDTGIKISDNLEEELYYNDILIYTDELEGNISKNVVISDIEKALQTQKKVICLRTMLNSDVHRLNEIALMMNTEFYYFGCNNQDSHESKLEYIPQELYEPEASVIMIGEMFRGLDGEHMCLSLMKEMELAGYRSVAIMEHRYASIVGACAFPLFIKSTSISECNKVYYMNNFIKHIEQTQRPDAIIILVPDAMVKYNRMFCNGFGIIPYLLSQAVQVDCFIFCTQMDDVDTNLFDSLCTNFKNRFGFGIDFVHMSNKMLDIQKSKICRKLCFSCQPQSVLNHLVAEKFTNCEIPIFNGLEKEQCKRLNCAVIERLENYYQENSVLI